MELAAVESARFGVIRAWYVYQLGATFGVEAADRLVAAFGGDMPPMPVPADELSVSLGSGRLLRSQSCQPATEGWNVCCGSQVLRDNPA